MKFLKVFLGNIVFAMLLSCGADDSVDEQGELKSDKADLIEFTLTFNNQDYYSTINSNEIIIENEFAYNISGNLIIKNFQVSEYAELNLTVGHFFDINIPPSIIVTAQDGQTSNTYSIRVDKDLEGELLFNQYSQNACGIFETIAVNELVLENNLWNASNLPLGSYSQCVYNYINGSNSFFGWQWAFPDDAYGVNAFPQVIYGWKPWSQKSTTIELPKKISEISKLKVTYDAEVYRNNGDYNLAFDNWINASSSITPGNIQFEFMIWEETNNLIPFGDYVDTVTTTNGVYEFYQGEPDWEPAGSNWTYIAFKRVEQRQKGTVDVDELLSYLIEQNIVPTDSFLASIELGNEVGNSTGYTIIKEFEVEIE